MRSFLVASLTPLCEALRAHGMSIMAALGHCPEVAPFKPQVRSLLYAESMVDNLSERSAILALVIVALAVGVLGKEGQAQCLPLPVIASTPRALAFVVCSITPLFRGAVPKWAEGWS